MAVAHVASGTVGVASSATNATSGSFEATGSDRLVVAGGALIYSGFTGGNISAMRWGGSGGTAMTLAGSSRMTSGSYHDFAQYYIKDADIGTGAKTVYLLSTTTEDFLLVGGSALSGVDQTTPLGTQVFTTTGSTSATVNASAATGDLVIDLIVKSQASSATFVAGTGQTERYDAIVSTYGEMAASTEDGAATVTMSWSWTGSAESVGLVALPIKVAAAAGVTVTPSVGTYRFVGQTPTTGVKRSAAPSVGTLRFIGQTPTAGVKHSAAPSVGTLRFDGKQPSLTVSDHVAVTPSVGALRFAGQTPTVGFTHSASPSVGTVRFVGLTPAVGFTHSVAPSVGALRFTGLQPTVALTANQWAAPSVGTFRFDGLQPTVSYTDHMAAAPSVGTFRFSGEQPAVAFTANQWTTPSVGSLLFAGQQPSARVSEPGQVSPLVGTLRFDGQQPAVGFTHSVAPSVGSVQFAGQQPSLTATGNAWVAPTVGAVHLAGYAPVLAVTANQWTVPTAGELRFDGQQPTLTEGGDKTAAPTVGVIRFVGYAPSALNSGDVRYTETPAGGGRRSRRRKYVVEVDGQEFVTDSLLEARELLRRATVIAEQQAPRVADAVVAQAIAKAQRIGRAQPVDVPMPVIRAPRSLKPEVDALKAVYREAAEAAELRMLMALQAERDDEETLLLLM